MKDNQTLSDKCYTIEAPELKISGVVYQEKDVKSAVKKLKDGMIEISLCAYCQNEILKEIDEIFGKELI